MSALERLQEKLRAALERWIPEPGQIEEDETPSEIVSELVLDALLLKGPKWLLAGITLLIVVGLPAWIVESLS